ncbi:P-II family nitrogen regulator [Acetonema longum]|uniref:Nitrogen regulatory protein P-II n=1 Tax=Acetonema longum DSM 6540 TaxID=1009370 RepID=F7NG48_9FIRM|nr:P-II family nitrogen regulator [Acetonema longum]EGO64966.1 nitrogen regulatory protein P-II [Acetonema longum DSM 6540]
MQKIECIIRPDKLENVKEALGKMGISGMTVTQVVGCGLQRGHVEVYRGSEYAIHLLPKVKIEIVAPDDRVGQVVRIVSIEARTGQIGDGKILIYPLDNAMRIRTSDARVTALL